MEMIGADTGKVTALLRVLKSLAGEIHLERQLTVIAENVTEVLDAERTSLFLYDREKHQLWSLFAEGIGSPGLRLGAASGLLGHVARTRRKLNLPDAYADERFDSSVDEVTGFRTRSVLCVPIVDRNDELVGVLQTLNKRSAVSFTAEDEEALEILCAHAAVALERGMLVQAYVEQQRLQEMLRLSREIQLDFLPTVSPVSPEQVDIHAYLAPADTVAGDLYDYFSAGENRLGFAIGDVSGKGIPAAVYMAGAHTLLRTFGAQGLDSARCLQMINDAHRGRPSMFLSLFYGVMDVRTGQLEYTNAGQNPPYIVRHEGSVSTMPRGQNLPICRANRRPFRGGSLSMKRGDLLFLYTDGLTEAVDADGRFFGAERLSTSLRRHAGRSAEALIDRVREDLYAFTGGSASRDDITMMAVRYLN